MSLRRLLASLLIVATLLAGCTDEPADETAADDDADQEGLTGQVVVTDPNDTGDGNETGEANDTGEANETGNGNETRTDQP